MTAKLPKAVGVGFKAQHFHALIGDGDVVQWIEVHAENYMSDGGHAHAQLAQLATTMPLSLHGVGLSLGGAQLPDKTHLKKLRALCARFNPAQISEHLAWAGLPNQFANDLLPIEYGAAALARLVANVDFAQQMLGRKLLIENPSHYLVFADAAYDTPTLETDFLAALVDKTGCGLLLDVNNIYVSCCNLGWSAADYLAQFPLAAVGELHLAGHAKDSEPSGAAVLIDNHGAAVADPVWQLYENVLAQCGALPSLVEWDTHIPDWPILRDEARKADAILQKYADNIKHKI